MSSTLVTWTASIPSPVGRLTLAADADGGLTHLLFEGERPAAPAGRGSEDLTPFEAVIAQLDEYFAGARREFDVPLAPRGTPFQLAAWRALRAIPYGQTRTYAGQAASIGRPRAVRAIGAANGRNPLAIIVPCHRVIGAGGALTGYGGGLQTKRWLLEHEQAVEAASAGQDGSP